MYEKTDMYFDFSNIENYYRVSKMRRQNCWGYLPAFIAEKACQLTEDSLDINFYETWNDKMIDNHIRLARVYPAPVPCLLRSSEMANCFPIRTENRYGCEEE